MREVNDRVTNAFFFRPPVEKSFIGHQIKEVYFDRVYASLVEGKGYKTCLDIGGNIGVTSYYFSHHFKQVFTLEPSVEHFDTLSQMLKHNRITNVKPLRNALYIKDGPFDFFHNDNKTMFSLHAAVNDGSSPPEQVEAITLKTLFEQEKIDEVDFMKLDIEGSEIEVFSHSDFKELAPRIKTILTERHAWSGRHPNQLNDALKLAGYRIEKIDNAADLVVATR